LQQKGIKGKLTINEHELTQFFYRRERGECRVLVSLVYSTNFALKTSPFDFAPDMLYHKTLPSSTGSFCNAPFMKLIKKYELSVIDMINTEGKNWISDKRVLRSALRYETFKNIQKHSKTNKNCMEIFNDFVIGEW
jgi:hypothetical protein